MRKDVIKGTFYSILAVSVITIGIIIIKLGDEQVEPSPFVSIVANKTLEEGKEVYYKERTIPPIRLNPADYARIHKEEIEEFIKKREEDEKNEKKAKEQVEQNEKNDNERVYQHITDSVKKVMEVTMYTSGVESTGKKQDHHAYGITASGNKVKPNYTIACPTQLDFGTKIYIPYFDNTYVCQDRGSAISSGHLDVYVNSLDKALEFGRRDLEVIIYK